ncbi:hypothetical protein [Roseospira goensis]|uniref:Uncharacterized protein n=1 Tax=Roseospira goensis TaxID=391922 RepID=A0A7W6WJI9_9PROT|nr:hypothetical protein [Roseospira goensis]MBB4285301.1 hypothetical protein [Roseospira goensis]
MTRRTRAWLGLIALLVVVGTALAAAVRVGVLTGGGVIEPPRTTVAVDLPDRGGRLALSVAGGGRLAAVCRRHVVVERAGQRIIDTALFPAPLDRRFGLAVYWLPADGRDGPYVRLADPAGDILLDLRSFMAWRITDSGGRPWLTAPVGVSAAGSVTEADGALTLTAGRPLPEAVALADGMLLGRVIETPDDGITYVPIPDPT